MTDIHDELKQRIRDVFDRTAPTRDQLGPRFFSHFGSHLIPAAWTNAGGRFFNIWIQCRGRRACISSSARSTHWPGRPERGHWRPLAYPDVMG